MMRRFSTIFGSGFSITFLIFSLSLFLPFSVLFALNPHKKITQYDMRIYKAEHGLPMNSIKKVFQDSKGYIWIGTQEGLVRFDGVRFELYNKSKYHGLKSDFIWDIAEDSNGNLWLATGGGGISCFDRLKFKSWDTSDGLINDMVKKVTVGKENTIWIGTETGLSKFKDNKFTNYMGDDGLFSDIIEAIVIDRQGDLYIGTDAFEFKVLRNDSILSYESPYLFFCFDQLPSGEIISGTHGGRILTIHGYTENTVLLDAIPQSLPNCIRDVCVDRDGNIWICTEGGGIFRYYDGELDTLNVENITSFSNNFFLSVIEDYEGNLWFGSESGLLQLRDNKFTTTGKLEGLRSNFGHTVCEDRFGNICAGFRDSGFSIVHHDGILNFEHISGLQIPEVTSIIPTRHDGLWIASHGTGLYRFQYKSAQNHKIQNYLEDPQIGSLYEDNNNEIWIGSHGCIYNYDGDTSKKYVFGSGYQEALQVVSIIKTKNGDLWFGTWGTGLYKIVNNEIKQQGIPDELLSGGVNALYEDKEGVLWIGTDNLGLYRYYDGEYKNISSRDGLFTDRLFSILEDDSSSLWFSTNRGIFCTSKKELNEFIENKVSKITCRIYDHLDGLRESECNGRRQPSAWKSRDGKLWFTSIAGIVSIDPNNIYKNRVKPPVYIENVISEDTSYYYKAIPLALTPEERNLEFRYTALSYSAPERVKFKYRLEGYDRGWIDASTRRSAFYTNLSKGNYTFHVIACNNDGIWNEEGASVQVTILPFWWETWWAYGFFLILSVALAALLVRGYIKRRTDKILKEEQYQLEKEHASRLEELDKMKSRFFANISHEFRTPLTLILSPLEQFLSKKIDGSPEVQYKIMHRNARRLLRLINQLLDLSKFEAGRMTLLAQPTNIVNFTKTIVMSFISLADRKKISLKFESIEESIIAYIDTDKFEKILINLLSNAFKFTSENGNIGVSVNLSSEKKEHFLPSSPEDSLYENAKGFVEIAVKDSGVGIPAEQIVRIFDRFHQVGDTHKRDYEGTGIGLALTKEFVELHKGEIKASSEPGKGSCFTVRIPIGKEHLTDEETIDVTSSQYSRSEAGLHTHAEDVLGGENTLSHGAKIKEPNTIESASLILIVEDNRDLRYYLHSHLTNQYQVIQAEDGKKGFEIALQRVPDLIISDIMMPGLDGFELCTRLKTDERTSHIPIILLTALAPMESKLKGLETGADDYLVKPFEVKELLARVHNLIELRKRLRQKYRSLEASDIAVNRWDESFLNKVISIINENMSNREFGVNDLAKNIGWSRETVYRKIKALTDLTAERFIYDRRLRHAEQLLLEGDSTITEISLETGFSSPSHLAKQFRKRFSLSPSQYRKRHAKNNGR